MAKDDEQVYTLKITCSGQAGKTLINLLAAIEYNTQVGHSATMAAFFDGDGSDKVSIEGLPENDGQAMAEACGNYGDDLMAMIGTDIALAYNSKYTEDGQKVVTQRACWPPEKVEAKPIKLEAAARLRAGWFSDLSVEERRKYVEEHPHSKYAEDYDNAKDAEPKDDNGDAERIGQLRKQIKEVTNDIAEIEAEDDDAGPERKHLQSLKEELSKLSG